MITIRSWEEHDVKRTNRHRLAGPVLAAAPILLAGPSLATIEFGVDDLNRQVNERLQLRWSDLETPDLRAGQGSDLVMKIRIDGVNRSIVLSPPSNRTSDYRLIEDRGNGVLVDIEPGPINTYRGFVEGMDRSSVAASYMNDLLYLSVRFGDDSLWWAEPLADRIDDVDEGLYAVYPQAAVISPKGTCGTNDFEHGFMDQWTVDTTPATGSARGNSVCTAVLACDADYEYFQDYGSTAAVENRINAVINGVNSQYESEVGLTHSITTIIVRTTSSDPYSGSIDNRLEQVRSHWNSSQGGISRDLVQLFTGSGGNGGTIGIAWLGAVCSSYGYSVVESDCCGSFGCTTDLSAHEFGHNWGADHCNCTGNTMNPSIVCANTFSTDSIGDIIGFRDSITGCLDGQCGDGGGSTVANDECSGAIFIGEGSTSFSTVGGTTSSDAYDETQCTDTYLGEMNDDVWFAWTSPASGSITVSTCSLIDFDSDIVIYQGNCINKTQIGCNGDADGCNGYSSIATADVSGGTLYLIRIGGYNSQATGSGNVQLTLVPSGDPVGGCCSGTFCSIATESDCGGTYLGDGTDCSGQPCTPTGACCVLTSCSITTQADCGGTYQGDGSDCSGDPCVPDPTGACCVGTSCSITTQAGCSGTYQGDGSDCSGNPCAPDPTGACCVGTSCSITTPSGCSGTYQGDGSDCSGDPCGDNGGGNDPFEGLAFSIVGTNLVDDAQETWTVDVYAVLADGCRLDAVAGDTSTTKMVSTTSSFYQNQFGGNTSASINPALFDAFPDLRYDSFVTIGRLDSSDNNLSDIGIDFGPFQNGGAIDASDGSWFITPDDAQGATAAFSNQSCEQDDGVLIARLTVRSLSASVFVEALFQGKDASGATWQSSGSLGITYNDCNPLCEGDFDGNGAVEVADLLFVIANWNNPYTVEDLLLVIANWNCGIP